MLTDAEWRAIMADRSKRIHGDLKWERDEDHPSSLRFRARVDSVAKWPLSIRSRYNPLAGSLSYTLVLETERRIYGLDMGKKHSNPRGDEVGKVHKHRWSEQYWDKEAYLPPDITAPLTDPVAVWAQFCAEANIVHCGRLEQPPVPSQGLIP